MNKKDGSYGAGQRIKQQLIPQFDEFKLDEPFDVVLSLEGEGQKSDIIMDIIFIIDVSGSMQGEKLALVKKSLILFSDLLRNKNNDNQIALVSFQSYAKLQLSWASTTNDNEQRIRTSIEQLNSGGYTKISNGFSEALLQLQSKQTRESVPYVILLSDGRDDLPREQCYNIVKSQVQKANIPYEYGLMTLGYGKDQDPELLDDIAKLKSRGLYYNIDNIQDAEDCFRQFFQIIENTFAHVKIEIAPIIPFEISSFNDEEFIKIDDKLQGKLELFKIGDSKDYFVQLICKKNKAQDLKEIKNIDFMHTKIDADLICQEKTIQEMTKAPQLTLCSDSNKILHVHPVFEQKQLTFEANQIMTKIIAFEKQGDKESVKLLSEAMLSKLETSTQKNQPQLLKLRDVYHKIQYNQEADKKINTLIECQRTISGTQPLIQYISRPTQKIILNLAESYELDIQTQQQLIKNLAIMKNKLTPTSKLTHDEFNNLITQNEKAVIVVYDKPNNQRKLKLIVQIFQNQRYNFNIKIRYQDIKLCMIDQKYHDFLDTILIRQKILSILFYNQHQLQGKLEAPQAYYTDRIEQKLVEYGMC